MNATDKELLEMAARALGMPPLSDVNGVYGAWVGEPETGRWWNPLEDDGDALRLAVKLSLGVQSFDALGFSLVSFERVEHRGLVKESHEGRRPQSATRLAIVRAAAEIGKSMTKESDHEH